MYIGIGTVVLIVIIVLVVLMLRRRLYRYRPDTPTNASAARAGEADLRAREKQRAQFDIKPLPEATRLRFADEWRDVQERFVDQPTQATTAADTLITRVMEARGYPMKDFDAQAELVSVDHPDTVENYRFAHAVRQRSQTQQVGTEDLREALLRYRSLFDELLRPEGNGAADGTIGQAQPAGASSRQRVTAGPEVQELGPAPPGRPTGRRPCEATAPVRRTPTRITTISE